MSRIILFFKLRLRHVSSQSWPQLPLEFDYFQFSYFLMFCKYKNKYY